MCTGVAPGTIIVSSSNPTAVSSSPNKQTFVLTKPATTVGRPPAQMVVMSQQSPRPQFVQGVNAISGTSVTPGSLWSFIVRIFVISTPLLLYPFIVSVLLAVLLSFHVCKMEFGVSNKMLVWVLQVDSNKFVW